MVIAEKWSISYHISKQGCNSHQRLQPSNVSPKSTQEGEYLPSVNHQAEATPYGEPQGSS